MNELVRWLRQYKEENNLTYRQLGEQIGYSHAHVAYVLKEQKPLFWEFCAAVAKNLPGIDYQQAFKLAGLLEKKQGDEAALPSSPCLENVTEIIANS